MRVRLILFSVLMLALSTGASCKTLRYASQDDPGTLDPHALASVYNIRVLGQVYDALVERNEQFQLGPALALSWSPLDRGKGFRFSLRPGVMFHDGTPFTADDVTFSVERALSPTSAQKVTLPNVTGARKVDDLTVDLLTSQATPLLPAAVVNFRIMSRAWCIKHHAERPQDYKAHEETFSARNANGTGPYRVREWVPDVKTVLVANPHYWGKHSNVTEAHYLVIRSGATRMSGLLSGELDIVIDPSLQDLERLSHVPEMAILETVSTGAGYLGFDYGHDRLVHGDAGNRNPFRDVRVRQAIRYAIDIEALRAKVMRDKAQVGRALFSPAVVGYDRKYDNIWPYDQAKARQLLHDAGYPDGFKVELDCSAGAPTDGLCQGISAMLAKVGLEVVYRPLNFNQLMPKLNSGDSSMYVIGWINAPAEAEGTMLPLVHTKTGGYAGGYNFGGYSNAEIDALLDRARLEFDPAKRKELFDAAMDIIDAQAAFIPLVYSKVEWAMRKNVKTTVRPNNILQLRYTNVE